MRLFIGVPVNEAVRRAAASAVETLKATGADGRWSPSENFHFTLHFLGETDPAREDELHALMGRAAAGRPPFELALGAAGSFGERSPKVLWLGLSKGAEELGALARGLFAELAAKGWPLEDRPYSPHLTLGRLKSARRLDELKAAMATLRPDASMPVERIALFESRPGPGGSRYIERRASPLGRA